MPVPRAGAAARIVAAQGVFGAALLAFAASRSLVLATACMVVLGLAVAVQLASTNVFLQVVSPPELRGRVLAIYLWLFVGVSPIGGFLAGWVAERVGAEATAAAAALACLVGAAVGALRLHRAAAAGTT